MYHQTMGMKHSIERLRTSAMTLAKVCGLPQYIKTNQIPYNGHDSFSPCPI
jgi:hypothetical protein